MCKKLHDMNSLKYMYASFGVQLLVFIPNIFVNMTVYLLFTYVDVVMKCLKFKKKKTPKKQFYVTLNLIWFWQIDCKPAYQFFELRSSFYQLLWQSIIRVELKYLWNLHTNFTRNLFIYDRCTHKKIIPVYIRWTILYYIKCFDVKLWSMKSLGYICSFCFQSFCFCWNSNVINILYI